MKLYTIILYFLVCFGVYANAQVPLDTSFNHSGIISDSGAVYSLIVQDDRKIIVCGPKWLTGTESDLTRFNIDGSIDQTFANGGYFSLNSAKSNGFVAIYPTINHKILLVGDIDSIASDFLITRLNANGTIDHSFGDNGNTVTNLAHYENGLWFYNTQDYATSLSLQSNNKILVLGKNDDNIGIVRYNPDGIVDSSFGQYGIAIQHVGLYGNEPNDLAVLPDDRLIVGFRASINGQGAMCAMRFLPNGAIDSSFNQIGYAYYSDGWLTYCNAMCLQPDGKVLLTGYADSALIVRFDTSGALDPTFGNGGVCKLPPAAIRGMALAPDGKILVTGTKDNSFVVYRCLPNGVLDTSFGNDGMILTKIEPGEEDRAECIALQADGKILVGGDSQFPGTHTPEFVLVRYLRDGHAGIENNFGQNGRLLIYPNPATDRLNIELLEGKETLAQITIYDVYGRLVFRQNNERLGTVAINIAGLASGIYFIHIRDDNGLDEEHKFVKK